MTDFLLAEKQNTGEDVRQYLRDIGQFPLLSPEEEKRLALRCAAGDEDAIRKMVNSNLRLVVSVAKGYIGRGVPLPDMIQEGSIGLVKAARKFDPEKNVRFSTYATKWIRQSVQMCVMAHNGIVEVPRYTKEKIYNLLKVRQKLQQTGNLVNQQTLAEASGIPAEKVEELLGFALEILSLDALFGEDGGTLADVLEDDGTSAPQEEMIRQELKEILEKMMAQLTPRQQQVLRLRFGWDGGESHSLAEVGEILGISRQRTRQIEQEAMAKLQKLGAGFGLEDFID